MKTILSGLILASTLLACNSKPNTSTTTVLASDTAGLSEYRQYKAQNAQANQYPQTNQYPQANQTYSTNRTTETYQEQPRSFGGRTRTERTTYYNRESAASPAYRSTSESGHTAYRKRGMSKGAKDAIIGGVGGAVIGAVADKKNRGVGALIGGVVGGGAGYGIGHSKDKKQGRN